MFKLFHRKPTSSEAARELAAKGRRDYAQRRRDTTDEMRRMLGLPPYQWRPLR